MKSVINDSAIACDEIIDCQSILLIKQKTKYKMKY